MHKAMKMLGLNPMEQEVVDIPNEIARLNIAVIYTVFKISRCFLTYFYITLFNRSLSVASDSTVVV